MSERSKPGFEGKVMQVQTSVFQNHRRGGKPTTSSGDFDSRIVESVKKLVDYMKVEEEQDYDAIEPGEKANHIVNDLKVVGGWLDSLSDRIGRIATCRNDYNRKKEGSET